MGTYTVELCDFHRCEMAGLGMKQLRPGKMLRSPTDHRQETWASCAVSEKVRTGVGLCSDQKPQDQHKCATLCEDQKLVEMLPKTHQRVCVSGALACAHVHYDTVDTGSDLCMQRQPGSIHSSSSSTLISCTCNPCDQNRQLWQQAL